MVANPQPSLPELPDFDYHIDQNLVDDDCSDSPRLSSAALYFLVLVIGFCALVAAGLYFTFNHFGAPWHW